MTLKSDTLTDLDDAREQIERLKMAVEVARIQTARRAVAILRDQHARCQPGTLVSYHIAAEVLALELEADSEG